MASSPRRVSFVEMPMSGEAGQAQSAGAPSPFSRSGAGGQAKATRASHTSAKGLSSPNATFPIRAAQLIQSRMRGLLSRNSMKDRLMEKKAAMLIQNNWRGKVARRNLQGAKEGRDAWDSFAGFPTPVNSFVSDHAWAATCLLEHPTEGPVGTGVVVDGTQFWGLESTRCVLTNMNGEWQKLVVAAAAVAAAVAVAVAVV